MIAQCCKRVDCVATCEKHMSRQPEEYDHVTFVDGCEKYTNGSDYLKLNTEYDSKDYIIETTNTLDGQTFKIRRRHGENQ